MKFSIFSENAGGPWRFPRPPFRAGELSEILALWAGVAHGAPISTADALCLPAGGGANIEITPASIVFDHEPSPEAMRAAMLHVATRWGGLAGVPLDASREFRLRIRAYAEVYGVEIMDPSESFLHGALTPAEVALLPAMRAQIRATHKDAPPARPDEGRQLAAMYRARYPFHTPPPLAA